MFYLNYGFKSRWNSIPIILTESLGVYPGKSKLEAIDQFGNKSEMIQISREYEIDDTYFSKLNSLILLEKNTEIQLDNWYWNMKEPVMHLMLKNANNLIRKAKNILGILKKNKMSNNSKQELNKLWTT